MWPLIRVNYQFHSDHDTDLSPIFMPMIHVKGNWPLGKEH
jgi:hypothetical protein